MLVQQIMLINKSQKNLKEIQKINHYDQVVVLLGYLSTIKTLESQ